MRRVAIDYPDRWREILRLFGALEANACIAGGCFRDLAHGKVPKDIDLFTDNPKAAVGVMEALGYEEIGGDADITDSGSESIVMGVTNWSNPEYPELPPVQVIEVVDWTDPKDLAPVILPQYESTFLEYVVNTFDFAFGQIGAGTDGLVYATPECLSDWDTGRITVVIDEGPRTVDRLSRIRPRFPGWGLRDTDGVGLKVNKHGALTSVGAF